MRTHRPPAQKRYDESHPTVSFRLEKKLKKRLKDALEGESFADFVKDALGARAREKKSLEDAKKEGHHDGYFEGYGKALDECGVYGRCTVCNEPMLVKHPEDKKALARFMWEEGWCHHACAKERRRRGERY